ncbi:MAG TPA: phosphatase PAP2 family protein [Gemmatimonadaceae bacterium]|nr:phosphatase PAP2 family protein [Gemmatimonadaceae bacterium]
MRPELPQLHVRRRWGWIVGGWLLALLAGVLLALPVMHTGYWHTGAPWEHGMLRAMHTRLPLALDLVMLSLPWLGTNITLVPLSLTISGIALARRRADIARQVMVVQLGAWALNPLLKELLARPRPELWEHRGQYAFASYPSGHAITSIAVLLTYVHLLHRERGWRWPYPIALSLIVVSLYSRLYLGVHWPWDVVAGVVMGVIWLAATLIAFGTREGGARGRPYSGRASGVTPVARE